jgi:Na+-translocating ferredoxin:NAD+ oxidoreductase RnfG subunit|tara:strand:- start:778 stop:978 length:201 start_codon:yes stop_codon:yes gene_type:complete
LPATIEDGFNGYVDLLVGIDMHGKIAAAIFIKEIDSHELFRVADIIESPKVKEFSHITIRDIQRIN